MGTNYYLRKPQCKKCGRGNEEIHLGKKSAGWKFLFHKTNEIKDFDSFCEYIKTGEIYDEYDRKISVENLLDIIENSKNEKSHIPDSEIINGYDFLDCDFC